MSDYDASEKIRQRILARLHQDELDREQNVMDDHERDILHAEQTIRRLLVTVGLPRLRAILERLGKELEEGE